MTEVNPIDNISGQVVGKIELNGKQLLLVEPIQKNNTRGLFNDQQKKESLNDICAGLPWVCFDENKPPLKPGDIILN
ncbi:hypothetical protein [Bacillus toyonensis]|uniref:hypothetical protein n=1 Tax=Bacillus toyonensis TaxID=155322 RepID=UPI000BEFE798|nr:hypothetical protein [Bacillus toyonensis]PEO28683.1 hypothetical protein CN589_14015 [Bacillus toyonensis]PFY01391.1 hypothetical protein COL45_17670 [Bacillus toyonensis]PHB83474.1 hypothetical protein COE93_04160 [Bacillus toyonensis]